MSIKGSTLTPYYPRGDDQFVTGTLGGSPATLGHMLDEAFSTGWIKNNNRANAVIDAGSETIDIDEGEGFIRSADSYTSSLFYVRYAALNGVVIPNNTTRYIYVSYNAGNPIIVVSPTSPIEWNTNIYIAEVHNIGGSLMIHNDPRAISSVAKRVIDYVSNLFKIRVSSGETVIDANAPSRKIEVSAGVIFDRHLRRLDTPILNTFTGGTFTAIYRDGAGEFTRVPNQTDWENTLIDTNTGTLVAMTASFYANRWVIRCINGEVAVMYGQAEYATQALAEAEDTPVKPEEYDEHGFFVARITFQKSAASAVSITSIKPIIGGSVSTGGGGVSIHNDLGGLQGGTAGEYYHVTQALYNALVSTNNLTQLTGLTGAIQTPTFIDIATGIAAPAYVKGRVFWDQTEEVLTTYNESSTVSLPLGRVIRVRVKNVSGVTILKGKAVYISGVSTQIPTIALAKADTFNTANTLGFTAGDIADNAIGYVTTVGLLKGINTNSFDENDEIYLSEIIAGEITNTKPAFPNYSTHLGHVLYKHISNGSILVRVLEPEQDVSGLWGILSVVHTRNSNTQFEIPDQGNNNKYDKIYSKGTVIVWVDTSVIKMAVVTSSSYGGNKVTVNIMGDILTATAIMTTFKFSTQKAISRTLVIAGTLVVGNDLTAKWFQEFPMKIFGVDGFHDTAGVTGSTTYQVSKNSKTGTNTILTSALTFPSGTAIVYGQTATSGTETLTGDYLTVNCTAISTTPPFDAYITIYGFPLNNQYLQ